MTDKIALFDLDGTLLNTNNLILASFKHTLKKDLGIDVTDGELTPYFGEPLMTTLERFDRSLAPKMITTYRNFNHIYHDELTTIFPGVHETLVELKENNFRLGIVTSKIRSVAIRGLELFDIYQYFDCVVAAEDTKEHKPHPQPILKALDLLGVEAVQTTIMVGDSPFDILSARAAGIVPVGVNWSVRLDELKELKPYLIIGEMGELVTEFRKFEDSTYKRVDRSENLK